MPNNMDLEQNKATIARLWSQFKRKGDGKCYCPYKKCKGLNNQIILITTAYRHCRQHDHIKGGKDFHPVVNVDFKLVEHGSVNIKEEGNYLTEEDDEEDHSGTRNYDDDEENLDIPLIEKAYEPLYQGSQTMLLSVVLLLVNFKVMNGISNVIISCMLKYSVNLLYSMLVYD